LQGPGLWKLMRSVKVPLCNHEIMGVQHLKLI